MGSDLRIKGDEDDAGQTCIRTRAPGEGCPIALQQHRLTLIVGGVAVAQPSTISFTHYDPDFFATRALQPTGGPSRSGTRVRVYMLDNRLLVNLGGMLCKFENAGGESLAVAASVGGDVHGPRRNLQCISPRPPDGWLTLEAGATYGEVTVDVSLNGGADWSGVPQTFRYYDQDAVYFRSMTPLGGPVGGATEVMLVGRGFQVLGRVSCGFGASAEGGVAVAGCGQARHLVPGTIINQTHAICRTPRSLQCTSTSATASALPPNASYSRLLDAVPVCLMLNGEHCVATPASASLMFTYYSTGIEVWQAGLDSLTPSGGPTRGGTLVRMFGRGLFNFGGLGCLFTFDGGGEQGVTTRLGLVAVAGAGNATEVRCTCGASSVPPIACDHPTCFLLPPPHLADALQSAFCPRRAEPLPCGGSARGHHAQR